MTATRKIIAGFNVRRARPHAVARQTAKGISSLNGDGFYGQGDN